MSYIGNLPTNVAFVTDSFSGDGSTVAFTTSVAPASTSSILVAVTGVLQDPSTYSVSGTTLTFSAAPPSGTGNISVRYLGVPASGVTTTAYRTVTEFTATAGQTSFSVPSYTAGYINVYRNGALLGTADYTATNGTTVVLGVGATVGDLVVTESFYVSSVLNAIPATAGAVNATYLNTDAVTTAKIADSNVTTAKIADSNVTTAKIADANVTQAKLASGVAGNGPAFSAETTATTASASTWTKANFGTENFDTNSNFASSRFTPSVAGYYQINLTIAYSAGTEERAIALYKNGSNYQWFADIANAGTYVISGTILLYMNGSTDYVEAYFWSAGGTTLPGSGRMSGALVRAA